MCFTRDPATGEKTLYGEFLLNAQGEDVVAGIRTPEPIERMREQHARVVRRARRDARPPRGALPRPPGHRVHGRGGDALPPPDADGEADRDRGASSGGRDGRRGTDLPRGGGRAHRPGPARPAPAPDDRPDGRHRDRGTRLERLARALPPARSCSTRTRPRSADAQGRTSSSCAGRRRRTTSTASSRPRRSHRTRRYDVPRRRRRTRDGQAVRRRLRADLAIDVAAGTRHDRRPRARRRRHRSRSTAEPEP